MVRLPVAHPSVLAAGGVDFQVEAAAVRELVDFVVGLGSFDPQIGEGLDDSGHDRAIRFFGRAKFDAGWLHKVRMVVDVPGRPNAKKPQSHRESCGFLDFLVPRKMNYGGDRWT